MALINLNLINKLGGQADIGESFVKRCCYNNPEDSRVSPEMFMTCIKRAVQADSLYRHLLAIYKESKDFAEGNFQAYIDEHESLRLMEEDPEFDPFEELYDHFDSGMISDLPKRIEQYSELVKLVQNFSEYREKLDQGFNEIFGDTFSPYHTIGLNSDGEKELVPRNELPEDVLNELDATRQIEDISIEYCLDGYNAFYQQCRAMIELHRPQGTIQECAKAIQALFVPYQIG